MRISLDYDDTYTRDQKLWDGFIAAARRNGHDIVCVTMRHDTEDERIEHPMPCEVIYTGRKAKRPFLDERSVRIDIWIDDSPHWIFQDG